MPNPHSATPARTAVIVGRWQLFHKGHETLLQAALACAEQVVVVIGSSFRSRNVRNPFNTEERQAMIAATLSQQDLARVKFLPVRDYFDDQRWNAAVRAGVGQLTDRGIATPAPPARRLRCAPGMRRRVAPN